MKMALHLALLFFVTAGSANAFVTRFLDTPTNSLEYRFLQAPDKYSIIVGGLLASGVPEASLDLYVGKITNISRTARNVFDILNPKRSAENLFSIMHKMALKKYSENATTLDEIFKSGRYNCLSSTLLYSALLEDNGYEPRCVALPTHIYTTLRIGLEDVDVENTSPNGFDIRTNREVQDNFRKMTGFLYSRDTNVAEFFGKRGLLAYTYANVAFFNIRDRRPYDAFQNSLKAAMIYPEGRNVITNAVAGYNGYALYLVEKNDYRNAIAVLNEAVYNFPDVPTSRTNLVSVYKSYVYHLVTDKKDFDAAFTVIDEATNKFPGEDFSRTAAIAYNSKANYFIIDKKDLRRALSVLKEAHDRIPNEPSFVSNTVIAYSLYSQYLVNERRDFTNALSILAEARSNFPAEGIFPANLIVVYRSYAAMLANERKDFAASLKVLKDARGEFPADKTLTQDTVSVYNAYALNLVDANKDYRKALGVLTEAGSNFPGDRATATNIQYVYSQYIDNLINSDRIDEAFKVYEESKKAGKNRAIGERLYTYLLFQLTEKKPDFARAFEYSKAAYADLPDSTSVKGAIVNALNSYAKTLLDSYAKYPKGEDLALKWHALFKDKNMDAVMEGYYSGVALKFAETNQPDKGIDIIRKGLTVVSNSRSLSGNGVFIAGNLAGALFAKKEYEKGLKYSKIALSFDDREATVLNNMKMVYRMKAYDEIDAKSWKKALATVEEGLKLFPTDEKLIYYKEYIGKKMKGN